MKKIIASLFVIILLSIYIVPVSSLAATTKALTSQDLVRIKGYTISKNTTISQVNKALGKPKIEGISAFGGKSYSYYDSTYTWYVYVETNSTGEIKGCGAVGKGFETFRLSYGDRYNGTYYFLSGSVIIDNDSKALGIFMYNSSQAEADQYWQTYMSDGKYLYDLQRHSIIVSHVLATQNNDAFPQTYIDEDLFYMNEQLKANGTDLYQYGIDTGKTKYISLIMMRTNQFFSELPNPIGLAKSTQNYSKPENYQYLFYDVKVTSQNPIKYTTTLLFIDPSFIEQKNTVELTQKEKNLLAKVKKYSQLEAEHLKQANEFYEKNNSYYETTPVYKNLPLTAGKWNEKALQTATDYINMARVGMGLTPLTLNKEIADAAQYKATLVSYMNANDMETGHYPKKPEGVSNDFYNKAQSYMTENLYMGDVQSSVSNALNDGYGDPVGCGHRYNLLNPAHTQWGVGSTASQGVHKFSGSSANQEELVAWPSNGVFPMDLAGNSIGNWTAKFYKNYQVSSQTEVTIKCLNNGKTYEITQENKNNSGKLLRNTGSNLLTFRDDNITYENGDVFEITLHNVTDSTGKLTDYTYRSVFKQFFAENNTDVTDIQVDATNVKIVPGGSKKIKVTFVPNDSVQILTFTSSNEKVAKVRQDGLITAVGSGEATISISCGNIQKQVKVTILPFQDVPTDAWYYEALRYTYEKGVIKGATDTQFKADVNISRGMFVTILWRMVGEPKVTGGKNFPDVKTNDYYYYAVKWASAKGIVNGYNSGKFAPNDDITREQLAVIIQNYSRYMKKKTSQTTSLSKYKDGYQVTGYAQPAVKWAVATGVISGKDNGTRLDPQGTATRAEATAMIYNYFTKVR